MRTLPAPPAPPASSGPGPRRSSDRITPSLAKATAWLAAFVLGLGLVAVAEAQPHRPGAPGPSERRERDREREDDGPAPASGPSERREQIKKKIRAMRAYTLTEELALDEQTAGRLFPVLARYDDETDKLLEKRIDVQRRLRHADSIKDAKAVDRLIDEAVANQRGFWDLEEKRVTDLRKVLTPVQAAKLLVVMPMLERKIQNQLRKAIVNRRTAGNTNDADDDQEPDELSTPTKPSHRREAPLPPRGNPSNAPGNTPPCNPNLGPCR
jgi:hypothetical protein